MLGRTIGSIIRLLPLCMINVRSSLPLPEYNTKTGVLTTGGAVTLAIKALADFRNSFFRKRSPVGFLRDAAGGIIIALVSIPISMGYAQIAGLPMQCGLYGSVLPIFLFGLLTSSRDFVFGVDAAPAALVGTALAGLGIEAGSENAARAVPLIAFFTACWLLLFFLFKADRIVRYISEPVMGGFISGICCTIILMQIPKLFGGTAGIGEAPALIKHIAEQLSSFSPWSFLTGATVIAVITLFRHIVPKVPMSVIIMAVGVILSCCLPLSDYGIKLLPETEAGLPPVKLPFSQFDLDMLSELLFDSLSIAAVILAESLLASSSNAAKDGYRLNTNRELLAYSLANFAASLSGCCPVNGSVSRTGIVRQFGAGSQWLSVFAAASMLLVLLFAAPIIGLLPVPVLTAIVISALMGACEFSLAKKLLNTSKQEFFIFIAAFLGVLIFGTVYGVMIGIVLSYFAVMIKTVAPPRGLMGIIKGREGFYHLDRNKQAMPVKGAVIYRFGGNIFFANTQIIQNDLEKAVDDNTKCVIINASAVSSIDMAASEKLLQLYKEYHEKNIRFYITEHIGTVNDSLRKFGADELIKNGAVRMTTALALRDAGIKKPYPTEPSFNGEVYRDSEAVDDKGLQAELEWALGDDAEEFKQKLTEEVYQSIKKDEGLTPQTVEKIESLTRWGRLNLYDEDELLDRLESRLLDRAVRHPDQGERIGRVLEERRRIIEARMPDIDPDVLERVRKRRIDRARELYRRDPETYMQRREMRLEQIRILSEADPGLGEAYKRVYGDILSMTEDMLAKND